MGDTGEPMYHDGCIIDSVVLSHDELDGQGKLSRTKILDDLIKDCTVTGRIFRMVKTTCIQLICTLNLIDQNPNREDQKPRDLTKNDVTKMQASFVKVDDSFDDTQRSQQVQRAIAESLPKLEKMTEKITLGLDEVYEVEMKWQRHKSKLVTPMVATREAIKRT